MANRIAGITVEIGGDTKKLTSALSGVNKQISSTQTALRDVEKLLKLDPANTELLSQKQELLKDAISETKDKLATLQEAAANSDLGASEHDALQREIIETQQRLESLEEQYRDFGSVAKQQLQAVGGKMQEIGGKISEVGDKISGFGKNITTRVTLPLAAIGTAGAANFAEVDKTMQLANKTMGITEKEANALNEAMKTAAANSTYGMNDAATAALNFARAGLNAEQAASALGPAMNLAAGEGGNLDTVSSGLVATINGFHGAFSDAEKYADVFAAACNNSALDVDSLLQAMSVAAPIFSSAGYTVNDAALYMGVMANNGIEAEQAANSLKTGLARLVSPAKEGSEMLQQLGISVTNADGSMKSSVMIQQELHNAFTQLSESEQIAAASAIFGKNQMAPWLALINTAPADVGKLNDSLIGCSGTTKEMADTMMGGFGGSIEKLKSSIDVLVYSLGQALSPTIQKVVDCIQSLVDKFNALSPKQQEIITKIALVAAAIGPVITVIGSVVSGIGSVISVAGTLMSALGALLSPVGLVVAAIAGVVAIGVALYKNWDEISAWASEKWTAIKDTVSGAVQQVKDKISGTWDNVKSKTSEAWENVKSKTSEAWTNAKSTVADKVNSMAATISDKFSSAKNAAVSIFDSIRTGIQSRIEAARDTVKSAIDRIRSFFNFSWSLPNIALPHFSISGSFSLNPPSIPQISVSWYKKAMDNAMVLDNATIFGAAGGRLLGGGEAGREVISGEGHLVSMIDASVERAIGQHIDGIIRLMERYLPACAQAKVVMPVDTMDGVLAERYARTAGVW